MDRSQLVTTGQAASAVGVSHRTLLYWVKRGWIKPTWTTPSGQHRWDIDDLRHQLDQVPPGGRLGSPPIDGQ